MPSKVTLSDGTVVTPTVTPDLVPAVSHSVASQQAAIDGGKMDGWQKVQGCQPTKKYACISGYTPSQVPNLTALADHFAISDRTFSMADSPSWGGHARREGRPVQRAQRLLHHLRGRLARPGGLRDHDRPGLAVHRAVHHLGPLRLLLRPGAAR